eukprot:Pgem_evm1s7335
MFFLLHVLLYILALSRVSYCGWTPWTRTPNNSPTHETRNPIWLDETHANSGDPTLQLPLRTAYY